MENPQIVSIVVDGEDVTSEFFAPPAAKPDDKAAESSAVSDLVDAIERYDTPQVLTSYSS